MAIGHSSAPAPRGVTHIGVRAQTMVWSKENLLNIGIARLPSEAKYIATIDADISFRSPTWAADTVHALQLYPVVQPWGYCIDLGPTPASNPAEPSMHASFGMLWFQRDPIIQGPGAAKSVYRFAHPGYAWAWTRQALEWTGGLIETAALGAADHHMAMALIGKVDMSIHGGMTAGYKAPLYLWQTRALQHMQRRLSYVPGIIEHDWHGPKTARKYVDRWDILAKYAFDPVTDLKTNTYGVIELAGNKPEMDHEIDAYFRQRNEDSNSP